MFFVVSKMGHIHRKIWEKTKEVAYTSCQIYLMLDQMHLNWYNPEKIRDYVKKNNLFLDLKKLGIQTYSTDTKYWIPKSNLIKIIEGMNLSITITEKDFEDAACALKYQI